MKRLTKLVCALAAMTVTSALMAVEVTPAQAQMAAKNWMLKSPKKLTAKFGAANVGVPLTSRNAAGLALYHVVNLVDGGFVVTSGDTKLPPIIAFSESGELDVSDEGNPLRALLERDLSKRIAALPVKSNTLKFASASSGTTAGSDDRSRFEEEWRALLQPSKIAGDKKSYGAIDSLPDVRVSPMVQSRWGQSYWNGYATFNYYTPGKYVSGCVATAFSQIMRYWQRPTTSVTSGSYVCWSNDLTRTFSMKGGTYSWGDMPLTSSECTNATQRQAIGKLLYDVGVASQMNWATNGSGTMGFCASKALRDRFGYASSQSYIDITGYGLDQDFTTQQTAFRDAILASLDAEMPVAIGVAGNNVGHEIVVDGYGYNDSTIYCHLNCGWSGSEDAWYNLLADPITSFDFLYMDEVGYNIHPTTSGDVISGRVLNSSGGVVSGATVTLTMPSGGIRTTTTNGKGIYYFRVTSSGTYKLSARNGSLTSDERSVALTISTTCTATITATGDIADASGNPVIVYDESDESYYYTGPETLGGVLGNSWGNDLTLGGAASLPDTPSLTEIATWGTYARTDYIQVGWTAAARATSYNVYRSTSSSMSSRIRVATNVTSPYKDYVSNGLTPGVKYWYWVEAVNSAGSAFSSSDWGNILVSASLSKTSLGFTAAGGTSNITVTANTYWSAVKSDSWLSISTSGTSGNGTIAVTATPNVTTSSRTGRVIVTAGAGTAYPKVVTNVVTQAAGVTLQTALDSTTLSFTTGGSSSWLGQTSITHDGVDAAQSGVLGNSQTNWLQTTVSGTGTISFWWYVSSEQGYDFLEFLIDGSVVASMSGTNNVWTSKSFDISTSGTHTLQWRYRKDGSQYRGLDAGFVDQVTWTPLQMYTVTYQLNGGTHGATHPTSATYGTAFYVSAPTKSGYTFAGWTVTSGLNASTAKWGTTSSPSASLTSSSTKCANGSTGNVYFKNLRSTSGSVTLTANWQCNHASTSLQNARAATCTEAGYTGDTVCNTCGATVATGSTVPALGHQEGAGVVTKEPTTTEEGVMTYSCTRCGIVMRTETIPKVVVSYPDLGFAVFANWDFGYSMFTTTNSASDDVFISAPVRLFNRGELFDVVYGYANFGEAAISNVTVKTMYEMVSESGSKVVETSQGNLSLEPYWGMRSARLWTDLVAGVYTARVTLDAENVIAETNRANNVREFVFAIRDPLALGIALGCSDLAFGTNGDDWYGTRDGEDATVSYARTKHLGNYGTNVLSTAVSGAGTLSFDWKVSSERTYDWLEFLIDGIVTDRISGTNCVWQSCSYELSDGNHAIAWRYRKDDSYYSGLDCAWLANVEWTPSTYAVTYKPGSYASGSTYTATKTNDVTLVLRGSTYTRTGYTQTGWSTSSDGTSKSYNLSASYTANSAITLYPYWTPNTYSVTYALNGGTHGTTHPSTATYDTAFYVSAPTKSGYAFTGWTVTSGLNTSTAKWGTTSSPSTSLTSSTTKCVNGATGNVYFKNLCSTIGNVTLTANWQCNHASTTVQNARAATCTEAGYTGDTVCNTCGATIATGSTVPALGHQEGAGVVTKEPTATEEGVMTYSCTRCGIVMRMEAIPKIAPPEEVTAPLIHINGSEAIVTAGEFTGESCEVSITCATEGVTIYYTTNGTTPRQIDRHMYTGPFTVTETVTIKAVAVFGEKQSEYMIVTITKRTLTLGEAASADVVGAALTWTTGGDAGWIPIIDSTSATGLSVQSGAIGDATGAELSRTWLQTEVTGNGTFSFRWKVNCEWDDSGESTWDRVMFFTNGVEVARMDGTSEWEELSFSFADSGTHTLRWEFVKDDYNDEEFRDRAWVSEFMWIPGGRIATLPEDATTEAVNAAVEGYEFADSDVERMINGDVHTFNDFALWSQGVAGGRDAVVASKYAVVSYLLRAERAFAEEPIIELGIDEAGQDGALALAVSIRDDVGMVAVSSEKVAEMFEATEDLQDWIGGRLELKVDDMTEGMSGLVRVNVRFGESLPARAFIRLRVKARISSITPPSDVEVSRTATGVMSISWDAVESATGYEVWRAKDEPIISNARMIAVVDDKTSYNDDDVEIGTMYYYWLRTMTGIGYSDFGDHIQGYAIPTFNVEFNANGGSGTMETMSVELGVQTNIVPNVFTRGGYAFAGWATNVVGEVVYGNGARIVPEEDMTLYAVWLDRPWSVSASDATSATAVDLTWAGVAHATSYQIWRGMSRSSSEATLIRSGVTGTSFSDTTVPVGTNYYYWVKAVCGTVTSEFSGYDVGRRMISAPQEVTVTTGSSMTDIVVKWSAGVAGAVRYEIWRAAYTQTSGGAITTVSAYSRIASINSTTLLNGKIRRNVTSYTDQPAFSGNIFYRYYVKAVSGTDTSAASNFSEVRTYQNIGTYSINLPKNGDYAVKMIGGGGGGAMCANSTLNGNVQAGGGSGAGFMGVLTLPSGSYTVSVGAGGFGVNYGTFAVVCNGASGGTTALNKGSSVIVSAAGGGGGSVNPYGFATGGPGGVLTTSRATVVSYTLMANGNVGGGLINAYASGGAALYQSYGRGGDATASGNVGFFQITINE